MSNTLGTSLLSITSIRNLDGFESESWPESDDDIFIIGGSARYLSNRYKRKQKSLQYILV